MEKEEKRYSSRLLKKGFVGKGEGNRDVNSGDIHRNWKT